MSQTIPEYGGCPWPMDPACQTDQWNALDPAVQERALALASSTLRRLTGYRVGQCPIKVRPARAGAYWNQAHRCPSYSDWYSSQSFRPAMDQYGIWVNYSNLDDEATTCEVMLPGPVGRVDEVLVDGVALGASGYEVRGQALVWIGGGECPFPTSQDLSKPDSAAGTFSVTYLNAYPVDSLGAYAVGVLANEYAKACTGNKCRLPAGVTNIVRQGVSMEVAGGTFPNGVTGIREVDSYVALWNPRGIQQAPKVWSPDLPRAMR